jgi:hypothetical protein
MVANAGASKPRVIGIGGLCLVGGALNILGSLNTIGAIGEVQALGAALPGWFAPLAYLSLVLGVLQLVAGVLIFMYKRLGLLIGGAVFIIHILLNIFLVVTNYATISSIAVNTIISLAALYYIYKYMTSEPEKTFFT